jgi:hypothetical protein
MSLRSSPLRNLPVRIPAIVTVKMGTITIAASMSDGTEVAIPIAWFPRLAGATAEQLRKIEISPSGYGIHWPEVDEDISVKAFFD